MKTTVLLRPLGIHYESKVRVCESMNTAFFPILLVDSILFLSFIPSKLLPLYDIAEDISSILTISSGPDGTRTHDPKVVRPE